MSQIQQLMQLGIGWQPAGVISADTVLTADFLDITFGATATGTTITDAVTLTTLMTNFGTVASGTGAKLPFIDTAGVVVRIRNEGANALLIYPNNAASTINVLSAGTAISLATATSIAFILLRDTGTPPSPGLPNTAATSVAQWKQI